MKCPSCNFENPDQFKFCGECGTRIVDVIPETFTAGKKHDFTTERLSEDHPVDAERRHITVVFCDLVGSTHLSEMLDPEDFRQLLHVYQDTCVYAVNQYEGHVAQYLGDGILVYFGYPGAHEDDTKRAVRCGLEIINELERLNKMQEQFPGVKLAVRIGIHTGSVIAGVVGKNKFAYDIWGDAVNTASRMESSGIPGLVNISGTTYELIKDKFECTYRGKIQAKNKGEIDMYIVDNVLQKEDKKLETEAKVVL